MKKSKTKLPKVVIVGAGKVGAALHAAAKAAGGSSTLYAARKFKPKTKLDCDLLILAVRDKEFAPLAEAIANAGTLSKKAVAVHVAGALTADAIAPLRSACAGVAQMHPMISFASPKKPPRLTNGNVHVRGDRAAETRARAFAKAIGMTPRTFPKLDPVGYHAAAAFVANGAAALAAIGQKVLEGAGVPAKEAQKMLGPLLGSVADNVSALGFPAALTGPIRRGDPNSVGKQLALLRARQPDAVPLFVTAGLAQIPLARALGEAPTEGFDAIVEILTKAGKEI
ncbi:MAG TPA: DUF2520 domain-containing protein [Polyangiaceae bacterium]